MEEALKCMNSTKEPGSWICAQVPGCILISLLLESGKMQKAVPAQISHRKPFAVAKRMQKDLGVGETGKGICGKVIHFQHRILTKKGGKEGQKNMISLFQTRLILQLKKLRH